MKSIHSKSNKSNTDLTKTLQRMLSLPAHTSKGSHFRNTSHITHCWSILLKAMRLQAIPCVGIGTRQFVRVDLPNPATVKHQASSRQKCPNILCAVLAMGAFSPWCVEGAANWSCDLVFILHPVMLVAKVILS